MEIKTQKLKRFLIGKIDESEANAIDSAIFRGEITSDEIEFAEHDLIEDYLEGTLAADEESLFRTYFLVSAQRRRQLDEIRSIRAVARTHVSSDVGGEISQPVSIGNMPHLAFRVHRFAAAAVAFAILAVIVFGIWTLLTPKNREFASLEKRYAELNVVYHSDLSRYPPDSVKSVFPSSLRGNESVEKVKVSGLGVDIVIRFALPYDKSDPVKLTVVRNGAETFVIEPLQPANGEVRAVLPREVLAPGQIRLRLDDLSGNNSPIIYDLRTE
jgi:hypothetical protein